MQLTEISTADFDLAKTLDSGQVFHWDKIDNGFIGAIGEHAVYAEQEGNTVLAKMASASSRCFAKHAQDAHATIRNYFALDHPLAQICASFPQDEIMNRAREFCRGLRIIRQPKWECLAMFICSSMKQVAHIRQISQALRKRYGEPLKIDKYAVHAFPPPERLAKSSDRELRKCALGYRAKNLLATARLVASGDVDLEKMAELSDGDLRARLCQLPGVGAKVANCVMLFAYERLRAFPIDVWIERVLKEKYFPRKRTVTAKHLREFSSTYFGEYGGYAQQYLFHHARTASRKSAAVRGSSTALRLARNDKKKTRGRAGNDGGRRAVNDRRTKANGTDAAPRRSEPKRRGGQRSALSLPK